MAFTSEILWELWAWLAVGIMSWGAALLFSRCRDFWRACMPTWYPSEVSYFVILFVMNAVLSTAGALTWALGGWFVFPYALSFTVGTLFLVAVAHFVLFTWYNSAPAKASLAIRVTRRRQIAIISSLLLVLALAVDIAATVFFYYAVSMVAFAFGILYGIYLVGLIIMNMLMAWHDTKNERMLDDNGNPINGPCGCKPIENRGSSACILPSAYARSQRERDEARTETEKLKQANAALTGGSTATTPGLETVIASSNGSEMAATLSLPAGMRTSGYAFVAKRK